MGCDGNQGRAEKREGVQGAERERGRRMNARVQTESVRSSGASVQTDDLGVLLHCLLGRLVAGALA